MIFQNLEGVFIKLGQILALRSDIVSGPLALELLNLLDQANQIPWKTVREVISHELSGKPKEVFLEFEETPIAAASFAQIHRAKTWDGEAVIVKVQRPEILKQIEIDFLLLRRFARLIDWFWSSPVKARKIISEFEAWTKQELDYIQEGKNCEALGGPKVFWQYTTKRILVEEFVEGVSLKEVIANPYLFSEIDGELISKKLIEDTMRQYFLNGFYHADPHPGNILVNNHNSLVYVDFGIVGTNQLEQRLAMANFVRHAISGNYHMAVSFFLHLGTVKRLKADLPYLLQDEKFMDLFTAGLAVLKNAVIDRFARIMDRWFRAVASRQALFHEKSAAKTFLEFLRLAGSYGIVLDRELVIFVKTLAAVDAISLKINQNFNLLAVIREVFAQPEYASLFNREGLAVLDLVWDKSETVLKKDSEKNVILKEYYLNWFARIAERHEKQFRQAFKKQERKEQPAPAAGQSWIASMQQALKHKKV